MSVSKSTPSVPTDTTPTPEQIAKARKFEREQLTRRQAIRKLGFGAGAAAFFALSTDDLTHMVGKELQKSAGDNKIANQVAKELNNAGIASADVAWPQRLPGNCAAGTSGADKQNCCSEDNVTGYCMGHAANDACSHCCEGVYGTSGWCGPNYAGEGEVRFCKDRCNARTQPASSDTPQ